MTRADDWRAIARDALAKFETSDDGGQLAHSYAYILGTVARMEGWTDPRVETYLGKVYSLRNPDGGWGLTYAWDAFGDGTVNPTTTTYTVTLADHVGPVLFDAHLQGLVPGTDIQSIVGLLMSTQWFGYSNGRCVAYSRSPNDTIAVTNSRNVHNVNASAAAFLARAHGYGFTTSSVPRRIVDVIRHEMAVYDASPAWWPYKGPAGGAPADTDHTSAQAEAMYTLAPYVGRTCASRIMTDPVTTDNAMATVARMRLTGLPARPECMSLSEPGSTLWAVLGDDWLADAVSFVATQTDLRHLAQAAYWASRNAAAT